MKRAKTPLNAFASLLVLIAALAAPSTRTVQGQPPADDGKRELTVTGCLLRSGYAGYQVEDARLDAIDGKAVAEQPQAGPGSAATPRKWILEGGGNLGPRVGEKVQVVGRSDWQPASPTTAADEPPNRVPRLDVKSIKTVAASCS